MLFDDIHNFFHYTRKNGPSLMAYDFIVNYLKNPLPPGRYEIDGDNIFANILEYDSVPNDKDYEVHKRYTDFQFIVSGEEVVYWEQMDKLTPTVPYDEEADVAFFKGGDHFCRSALREGQFAVFYPDEPHKPSCQIDGPTHVQKIVIKILAK